MYDDNYAEDEVGGGGKNERILVVAASLNFIDNIIGSFHVNSEFHKIRTSVRLSISYHWKIRSIYAIDSKVRSSVAHLKCSRIKKFQFNRAIAILIDISRSRGSPANNLSLNICRKSQDLLDSLNHLNYIYFKRCIIKLNDASADKLFVYFCIVGCTLSTLYRSRSILL